MGKRWRYLQIDVQIADVYRCFIHRFGISATEFQLLRLIELRSCMQMSVWMEFGGSLLLKMAISVSPYKFKPPSSPYILHCLIILRDSFKRKTVDACKTHRDASNLAYICMHFWQEQSEIRLVGWHVNHHIFEWFFPHEAYGRKKRRIPIFNKECQ